MLRDPRQGTFDVVVEISPHDEMYGGEPTHYFSVGRAALSFVQLSLRGAGLPQPERILDLPCGHGRVLRFFKAAFPDAELVACDLNRGGVDFCAETFGAHPAYSTEDPSEIQLDGQFDLIWCGSLLTHVGAEAWIAFLRLFESLLSPQGLMVFTTNGPFTWELLRLSAQTDPIPSDENEPLPVTHARYWPRRSREYFPLSEESKKRMLRDYDESGFGYADYPGIKKYGLSVASPTWICGQLEQLPALKLVTFLEHGWDGTQDVVACARRERWFSVDG